MTTTIEPPKPPRVVKIEDATRYLEQQYRWLYEVYKRLEQAGLLDWDALNFSGSSLSDIANRSHTLLTDIGTNTHANIDSHIGAVSAHGAGTAIVGTSTVQTLTNKTIVVPYTSISTNTVLSTQDIVKITAAITVTLPTAVGASGRIYVLDNAHTGTTTVNPTGAEKIEGESSQTITGNACMVVYSDGVGWRIK